MVTGIDVSQTSIEKASKQFPWIRFIVGDLTKGNPFRPSTMSNEQSATNHDLSPLSLEPSACSFDLVVIKEVLWYVCHNLKQFMQNVISMIKKDGFLYVSQSFPESDKWVGQDVIDSPERLKEIMLRHLKPVHICTEVDWNYNGRPLIHFLGKMGECGDR